MTTNNKQLLYVMNLSVQPEKQDSSLAPDVQRWTAHALIGQVNGVMGFDLLLLWTRITSLGSQRKSSSKSGDVIMQHDGQRLGQRYGHGISAD